MLIAIIAVVGTLAGSVLTGVLAHLTQRAQRSAADASARRAECLIAVTDLVAALDAHRRAMWVRENLRLRGEDWADARAESYATRAALSGPLLRVRLLLPALAPAAVAASQAASALRGAENEATLRAAREHAITAVDDLVTATAATLTF
ncbi:protein kilB [Streptomyces sp. NPDC057496]|uniref:protein kilB n=1 Tax=Streptomyces sp. NPDC057496 TaxID=3346149 RepID=UPI0036814365